MNLKRSTRLALLTLAPLLSTLSSQSSFASMPVKADCYESPQDGSATPHSGVVLTFELEQNGALHLQDAVGPSAGEAQNIQYRQSCGFVVVTYTIEQYQGCGILFDRPVTLTLGTIAGAEGELTSATWRTTLPQGKTLSRELLCALK